MLALLVVLAAALGATACASSSSGSSGGGSTSAPYRVMVTGGLSATGVLAANAETSVLSAEAGAKVINSEGGIDGRKVIVTSSDDAGDPTTAVTNLLNAIHSGNKPDLYLNSGPSTISAATLPILTSNHILSFNIGPTSNSNVAVTFPDNFDLSPSPTDYAKGFVLAMQQDGYKTAGIVHGNDAYGSVFGSDAASALQSAGLTVTSNQSYDVAALSMTAQLQVFHSTVYSPSATLVNQAVKAMLSLGKIDSTLILAYNYDAFPLVQAAAKYAHSTTAAAIAAALAKPAVQAAAKTAVLSRYNFTASNHSPAPDPSEFTFISPTQIVNGQYGHP